jgi:hypothetical protein
LIELGLLVGIRWRLEIAVVNVFSPDKRRQPTYWTSNVSTVGSTVPYFEKLVRSYVVVPLDSLLEMFCVILGLDAASVGDMLPVFVYVWHRVGRVANAGQAGDLELKGPTVCTFNKTGQG